METEGILGKQQQVSPPPPIPPQTAGDTSPAQVPAELALEISSNMSEIQFNELIVTSPPSSAELGQFGIARKTLVFFSLLNVAPTYA